MRVYFATSEEFKAPFRESEEGLHFCLTLDACNDIFEELRDKKFIYSIEIADELKPLQVDDDILYWSGPNIAELLLCKLDNINYEAAFINQDDIAPSKIHVAISEADREKLQSIKDVDDTINSFALICDYLRSKGFNSIIYRLWEGNRKYKALILRNDAKFKYDTLVRERFMNRLDEGLFPDIIIEPIEVPVEVPEGPKTESDNGVATLLINAVADGWQNVDKYNSIRATIEQEGLSDIVEIIKEVTNSELASIGKLTKALESVSPNVAITQQGEVSAEVKLTESALNEMAYDRADAIERCASLGKQFIEHFNRAIDEGQDAEAFLHHCQEMFTFFKDASSIVLKQSKKQVTNNQLIDWFFTVGSSVDVLFSEDSDKEDIYNEFIISLLANRNKQTNISDILVSILNDKGH